MSDRRRPVTAVAVAVLLAVILVGGASGVVADESVDLQEPSGATVSDGAASATGEVELLVELSDYDDPAGVGAMQARAAASQSAIRQFATTTPGVTVENRFWLTNAVLLRVDTERVPPRTLARIDGVRSVARNARVRVPRSRSQAATATGNQTANPTSNSGSTYGLEQVGAPEVWSEYGTRGGGTSVAVLDTGVDPDHPDITVAGWADFSSSGERVGSSPRDVDPGGHGTHASGTVAGGESSGQHIGVAPDTKLYHGAALTECNSRSCTGTFAQIIAGMEWAVARDVDVLSMSLGSTGYNPGLIRPVRNAEQAGTTVVAAAGNKGVGTTGSPANIPGSIAVGAVSSSRTVAAFSGGERVDTSSAWGNAARSDWPANYVVPTVSAPGVSVESSLPGGGYGLKSGTSMATPHVAGAVALLQAATDAQLSPDELESALVAGATKPPGAPEPAGTRDTRYGAGIIDVPAAIESVEGPPVKKGFTVSPQNPVAGETVTLTARNTSAVSYAWDLDADGVTEATGQTATTTFDSPGEYNVTLGTTRADGTETTTSNTVTVVRPLTAVFTPTPSTPETGETVTFEAVPATGADAYEWDLTGDGTLDRTGQTTTFSYAEAGAYDVTLTVVRGAETATTTQTVQVTNPATTGFSVSPEHPEPGETVVLTAKKTSADRYAWDLNADGEAEVTGQTVTTTFGPPGEYNVSLTVTRADGTKTTTTGTVTVVGPLSAGFTVDPPAPETGTDVTFEATPVAEADAYEWDFTGDGLVDGTGRTTTFSYAEAGAYNVTLTVVRGTETATATQTLNVTEPLTAGFSITPSDPEPGEEITFDASSSTGSPGSYTWVLGGRTETGAQTTATFETAGRYNVTLTVTRGEETDTTTRTVAVARPLLAAFTTEAVGTDGLQVSLDASQTQGLVESYEWDVVGDSAPEATGETATYTFWTADTYEMTLTVTTLEGQTDTTSKPVTVGNTLPPVVGSSPPADIDGDGLHGDVRGDGGVTLLDVQALFDNLDSGAVQNNPAVFDFAGVDTDEVTVLDVQALFNDL